MINNDQIYRLVGPRGDLEGIERTESIESGGARETGPALSRPRIIRMDFRENLGARTPVCV